MSDSSRGEVKRDDIEKSAALSLVVAFISSQPWFTIPAVSALYRPGYGPDIPRHPPAPVVLL